ncbi:MAG TPA: NUDIX domain-containing protein [Abditibacteriaceae bacterium]|jgi:8-oxo-dGTP pyrophosphatase MutT (NUDIX family)
MVTKVAAYIFRRQPQRNELLVFAHRDHPEVPIQVPGGTVDDGEELVTALLREVEEESGLTALKLVRKLGTCRFYRPEINGEVERHFYLLEAPSGTPDAWQHLVFGTGIDCGLVFSYYWVHVNDSVKLTGDQGRFLHPEAVSELYA